MFNLNFKIRVNKFRESDLLNLLNYVTCRK